LNYISLKNRLPIKQQTIFLWDHLPLFQFIKNPDKHWFYGSEPFQKFVKQHRIADSHDPDFGKNLQNPNHVM